MDDIAEKSGGSPNKRLTALRGVVLTSSEGHLLLAGIAGAFIYSIWLGVQLVVSPAGFQTLIGLTATEVVFGRIACMAFGYSLGMGSVEVILLCMVLETILVLVFYPLFVFIWQHLLVIRWLKRLSDRIRTAAENHKGTVHKYGIIGLFAFVWLPFWMTGPVVGCMIGYLLRFRVWVNITTVLAGTYVAILGWAFLMAQVRQQTTSYSSYSIVVLAVIVVACGLTWVVQKHITR